MKNELIKHQSLIIASMIMYVITIILPYIQLSYRYDTFRDHMFYGIGSHTSYVEVMLFIWAIALPIICVAAYWTKESIELFLLEIWRHQSMKDWAKKKLIFVFLLNTFFLSIILMPVMIILHSDLINIVFSIINVLIYQLINLSYPYCLLSFTP